MARRQVLARQANGLASAMADLLKMRRLQRHGWTDTSDIRRLEAGNFGAAKSLRDGVFELRLDFGAGYRVYYGREGPTVIILLGGGSKRRQDADIAPFNTSRSVFLCLDSLNRLRSASKSIFGKSSIGDNVVLFVSSRVPGVHCHNSLLNSFARRFDELFFVDLPNHAEREAIWWDQPGFPTP
jgi:putative addiction module killer protein